MEFYVHTPNLLKEITSCKGASALVIPLNTFARLLARVAERAIEINDDELNRLMLKLTLYDQADPESPNFDPSLTAIKAGTK